MHNVSHFTCTLIIIDDAWYMVMCAHMPQGFHHWGNDDRTHRLTTWLYNMPRSSSWFIGYSPTYLKSKISKKSTSFSFDIHLQKLLPHAVETHAFNWNYLRWVAPWYHWRSVSPPRLVHRRRGFPWWHWLLALWKTPASLQLTVRERESEREWRERERERERKDC